MFEASESRFFTVLQGQNHTGTPKTPFSETKNGVCAILTSKLKGFISVFAVFSILERVCKVYHASENGFFTICQPRKVGFAYSEEVFHGFSRPEPYRNAENIIFR